MASRSRVAHVWHTQPYCLKGGANRTGCRSSTTIHPSCTHTCMHSHTRAEATAALESQRQQQQQQQPTQEVRACEQPASAPALPSSPPVWSPSLRNSVITLPLPPSLPPKPARVRRACAQSSRMRASVHRWGDVLRTPNAPAQLCSRQRWGDVLGTPSAPAQLCSRQGGGG